MNRRHIDARLRAGLVLLVGLVTLALPVGVAAHAELETANPPDGAVLSTPPAEIVLTFSEALDASKSSLTLHDDSGTEIARGSVDPANAAALHLTPPASMQPGTYEIRWTSGGTDAHLERGTLHFGLTAPSPSPTPTPTPEPSASPTPIPSPSPSARPSPSPSAPTGPTNASGTDVLLPIIAALVLVVVLGWVLLRSRSRGGGAG